MEEIGNIVVSELGLGSSLKIGRCQVSRITWFIFYFYYLGYYNIFGFYHLFVRFAIATRPNFWIFFVVEPGGP